MKVLIILKKWPGGVGVVVKNLKKELDKRKHEVKIISREEDLKCYSLIKSIIPLRKEVSRRDYDILCLKKKLK